MIVMCIASGITAYIIDRLDGLHYSHPAIGYWNAFACFLTSIVTGEVLLRLHQTLREKQKANEELQHALTHLEASTLEIRKLQDGLQTICAWTNRIKVRDQWMTPDQFLSTQLHLNLTHGISPEALQGLNKDDLSLFPFSVRELKQGAPPAA